MYIDPITLSNQSNPVLSCVCFFDEFLFLNT